MIKINELPGMKVNQTVSQKKSKTNNTTIWYYGQKLANVKISDDGSTTTMKFAHETVKMNTEEVANYDFKPKTLECSLENKKAIIEYRLAQIESDFV